MTLRDQILMGILMWGALAFGIVYSAVTLWQEHLSHSYVGLRVRALKLWAQERERIVRSAKNTGDSVPKRVL